MTATPPITQERSLILRYQIFLSILVCIFSALCLPQALPESFNAFFLAVSQSLDTHGRWMNTSYKYREQIVQVHYVAVFVILPSLVLGLVVSLSRQEIEAIKNISYFRLVLGLCIVIILGIQLVFGSGSEAYISQRPEFVPMHSSTRTFNSFMGVLLGQYLNVGLWVCAGGLIKSLFLKNKL
jgi:hypothetical protein